MYIYIYIHICWWAIFGWPTRVTLVQFWWWTFAPAHAVTEATNSQQSSSWLEFYTGMVPFRRRGRCWTWVWRWSATTPTSRRRAWISHSSRRRRGRRRCRCCIPSALGRKDFPATKWQGWIFFHTNVPLLGNDMVILWWFSIISNIYTLRLRIIVIQVKNGCISKLVVTFQICIKRNFPLNYDSWLLEKEQLLYIFAKFPQALLGGIISGFALKVDISPG